VTEAAAASTGLAQGVDRPKSRLRELRKDQLGDAISPVDRERPVAEVEQDDTDLAPVVRVDRSEGYPPKKRLIRVK